MIDTGASLTIISDATLKTICPNRLLLMKPFKGTLLAINDTPIETLGMIDLQFDNVKSITCVVVPDIHHEFIIGINSLIAGQAKIDLNRKKMIWFNHKFDMIPYQNTSNYISSCILQDELELKVQSLLLEYPEVFNDKSMPEPIITSQKMHIDTGSSPPIKCQSYRPALRKQHILENQVNEMVEAGILKPCTSPWASPCLLVPKPDGTYRLVGSFVKLNKVTLPDTYPLPNIQQIFDGLRGSKYYSTLDLKKGYFQIELDEESQLKASITCHLGTYKYCRAAMGLKNSGASFCRAIEEILRPYIGRFLYCYVDDILVFSQNLTQHFSHLRIVLDALQKANVQLRKSKCFFVKQSIDFLGYNVTEQGIHPIARKLNPILNAPSPQGKKSLQSFLGSTNYYRKFIPNYSMLTASLYDLLKQHVPFNWTSEHEHNYCLLKSHLTSDQILSYPRIYEPYNLYVDASQVGIGSVLCQYSEEGEEKVIQYYSRKLSPVEKRYSTVEREALALIASLKEFRPYLIGGVVNIHTDHKPLLSLFKRDIHNARINRWKLEISDYQITINYIKGSMNFCPDFLSRQPISHIDTVDYVMLDEKTKGVMNHIPLLNDKIPLSDLLQQQRNEYSNLYSKTDDELLIHNDLLYSIRRPTRLDLKYPRLLLPSKYRLQVIRNAHDSVCHQGIHKTLSYVRTCYVWKGMRNDIMSYINECSPCQLNRRINVKKTHHVIHHRNVRNALVSMDITGPLMTAPSGNKYILSIIDHASRWCEMIPLPTKTSLDITEAFYNHWICRYGLPACVLTDNAKEFKAKVLVDLCKRLHIERRFTSFYNPSCQGKNERVHATIKSMLRKLMQDDTSQWEKHLHACLFAYRTTVHSSIGVSPYYLQYGDFPNLPFTVLDKFDEEGSDYYRNLQAAFQIAKEETRQAEMTNATRMNKISTESSFKPGDVVVLKNFIRTKMSHQNKGYFQVVTVRGPVLYMKHLFNGSLKILNVDKCRKVSEHTKMLNLFPERILVDSRTVDKFIDSNLRHRSSKPVQHSHRLRSLEHSRDTSQPRTPTDINAQVTTPRQPFNETSHANVIHQENNNLRDSIRQQQNQQNIDTRLNNSVTSTDQDLYQTTQKVVDNNNITPCGIHSPHVDFNIHDQQFTASTPTSKEDKDKYSTLRSYGKYKLRRKVKRPDRYGYIATISF
jgi:hypothetical protein